jgi:mannitol/fructose-specific phosphotransferase system IIA component (Ntr-type)
MDLTRLLPAAHCIPNITATTREEADKQLMQPLIDTGIITDSVEFYNDLERREKQITTVIGNGVAIPHARTQSATRLGLSVGFLAGGQSFQFSDEEDIEEVNLIFMIAIPSFAPASHLPLLQHIAKFIRHEKKIAKLLKSKTPAAMAKYLHSFKTK